jgi:hypothetical protein
VLFYFTDLLQRAVLRAVPMGGSTLTGILVIGILGVVAGFGFTVFFEWRRGGRTMAALTVALKSWTPWAGAICGSVVCWIGLVLWQIPILIYQDHQALVALTNAPRPTCPACAACPACPSPTKQEVSLCLNPVNARIKHVPSEDGASYESEITITEKSGIPQGRKFQLYFLKGGVNIGTVKDSDGNDEAAFMSNGPIISTITTKTEIPKGKALIIKARSWEFPVALVCADRLAAK